MGYTHDNYLKCERLLYLAARLFRQNFIFTYSRPNRDEKCYTRAAELIGTAKLVFLDNSLATPNSYIPCLTCFPIRFSQLHTISLASLKQEWDEKNKNLHKYVLHYMVEDDYVGSCGLLFREFGTIDNSHFCIITAIAAKYNLTLVQVNFNKAGIKDGKFVSSFGRSYSDTLSHSELDDSVYHVGFAPLNFLTITDPPSHGGGVTTVVSLSI